ncbi:MAG: response regulator transcription factor [Bacteroidota bacterium]
MDRIRIYHIEDYKIMRDGIKFLLTQDTDLELVGSSANPDELFTFLKDNPVDVLILDIFLDNMEDIKSTNGFEICTKVKEDFPNVKVVTHSAYTDAEKVSRMINAGASGFVSKKSGYEELIFAIKRVHSGARYISVDAAKNLKNLNKFLEGMEETLKTENEFLTNREMEVLFLLAKGYSTREIAASLFINERTVETHRKNMVEKARVKNTVELVAYAVGRGLLKV